MTIWINCLRRWLGRPEVPLATSGETSVLFVLQSHSPKTRAELSEATKIPGDELAPLLDKLERQGRIRSTFYRQETNKQYWIIKGD